MKSGSALLLIMMIIAMVSSFYYMLFHLNILSMQFLESQSKELVSYELTKSALNIGIEYVASHYDSLKDRVVSWRYYAPVDAYHLWIEIKSSQTEIAVAARLESADGHNKNLCTMQCFVQMSPDKKRIVRGFQKT